MIDPAELSAAIWPTWILVLVASAAIYAQAFVRLIFGFRMIIDRASGARVWWVQIGWVVFMWLFCFAAYWPVIDVLAQPDWTFGEFLYMVLGAILMFLTAYVISPDPSYVESGGTARYLQASPWFFGLLAGSLAWLAYYDLAIKEGSGALGVLGGIVAVAAVALAIIRNSSVHIFGSIVVWGSALVIAAGQAAEVIDGNLRQGETAPIQGGVIAIWLASLVISVALLIMITMAQLLNPHSGFRPYWMHTSWCIWLFASLLLVWWRSPLLVTEGWDYHHFIFVSIAPLLVSLAWLFFLPTPTGGDAVAARVQYFDKSHQAFPLLAAIAIWAIVMNAWLIDGSSATAAVIGWAVLLALFVAGSRTDDQRAHIGAAVAAWAMLISEFALDLDRGVPAL
ncbi:MAG: hypothetical protein ACR2OH_14765 [Microthrixaceae bacterium]